MFQTGTWEERAHRWMKHGSRPQKREREKERKKNRASGAGTMADNETMKTTEGIGAVSRERHFA